MFDVDKSGDISADDLVHFYNKLLNFKRTATGMSSVMEPFTKEKAMKIIDILDIGRHKAITPDQFLNIIMASQNN